MAAAKKITLATVKSFIKKNAGKLYISERSRFDGMVDCVMPSGDKSFRKAQPGTHERSMGVSGAWFVGQSRDWFSVYVDADGFYGYNVSNCCGSFVLAVKA